jgi:predicted nuclease with TOPRIM domain
VGISDRLGNIRQLLPGSRQPVEDERLLQLYWNRAELKKELSRLQDERHSLLEQIKKQEGAAIRAREQLEVLEQHLGDPDVATHAMVYFQLRALWRICAGKIERFAQQLRQQQQDRERRRQLIEFDQARRRQFAEFDRRLAAARAEAGSLEAQVQHMESELAAMRGFWNYFRRRKLAEDLEAVRVSWDTAATQVTDLSDDRAEVENQTPPAFAGISIDGRRIVNTAVIAYAQQLASLLSTGGLAMLAKETTAKRVFDISYGSREDCVRLMSQLREAGILIAGENEDLGGLKECTDALRGRAAYRSDADTVPLTDSIGTLALAAAPVSGLESINRTGINVLVDDYWDLYRALLQ